MSCPGENISGSPQNVAIGGGAPKKDAEQLHTLCEMNSVGSLSEKCQNATTYICNLLFDVLFEQIRKRQRNVFGKFISLFLKATLQVF